MQNMWYIVTYSEAYNNWYLYIIIHYLAESSDLQLLEYMTHELCPIRANIVFLAFGSARSNADDTT